MSALRPAIQLEETATCTTCGARSEPAYSTKRGDYRPGYPLMVEWRNGARPQCVAAIYLPDTCPECSNRRAGLPPATPETPQETFARLAGEFERATGVWAPGRRRATDPDDGVTEDEREARWLAWLRDRNRTAQPPPPPPKPKGQMALF